MQKREVFKIVLNYLKVGDSLKISSADTPAKVVPLIMLPASLLLCYNKQK